MNNENIMEELCKLCFRNSEVEDLGYFGLPDDCDCETSIIYKDNRLVISYLNDNCMGDITLFKYDFPISNMFFFINTIFPNTSIEINLSFCGHNCDFSGKEVHKLNASDMTHFYRYSCGGYEGNENYSRLSIIETRAINLIQYIKQMTQNAEGELADFLNKKFQNIFIPDADKTDYDKSDLEGKTILWGSFGNNEKLTSISIPESFVSIDNCMFYECKNLISVNLPEGLTSIGDFAFSGCENLKSIKIPDSVESIGNCAFKGCKKLADKNKFVIVNNILFDYTGRKTEVVIPDNVTQIGKNAFKDCKKITSVTIPSSVTSISDYAFYGCTSLCSVSLPDSLTDISDTAFLGTGLKKMPAFGYVIDGSKCNWKKVNPEDLEKMLKDKDYSIRMDHPTKYQFVAHVFLKDNQPKAEEYIKKNVVKIIQFFIDIDDYETIKALLESEKFVTKSNIMKFIDYAIEHTQKSGDMQIQVLLMNYKNEHFPNMDPMKDFNNL